MRRFLATLLPLVAAVWLAAPASAPAQSSGAADLRGAFDYNLLKAAFEFNFVKFTEWPEDMLAAGAPLTMCVFDDRLLAVALERTVSGHTIGGHELRVSSLGPGDSARACHVVDVGGLKPKARADLLADLKRTAVLTVSDAPVFARQGGIAELYAEGNQIRFAVNLAAAQRARLKLSAKLLSLAKLVEGD